MLCEKISLSQNVQKSPKNLHKTAKRWLWTRVMRGPAEAIFSKGEDRENVTSYFLISFDFLFKIATFCVFKKT